MRQSTVLITAICVAAPAMRADAQKPGALAGATRTYDVRGRAYDSLNSRPLAGAEVLVEGRTYTFTTATDGSFVLRGLQAGDYSVGIFHPLLDSLSTSLGSRRLSLPVDSAKVVTFAIPPVRTLVRVLCGTAIAPERSVLVGRVFDADSERPIANARVTLSWSEFQVDKREGIKRTPHLVHVTTGVSGVYRFCGLPPDLDAVVSAERGNVSTAQVPIHARAGRVVIRPLALAVDSVRAARGTASLRGRVSDADGSALPGARISLSGSSTTVESGPNGEFALDTLPSGTRLVLARKVGFIPASEPVELTAREVRSVRLTMQKYVSHLDPVVVRARRDRALSQVGFAERRKSGLGAYVSREEFERRNPRVLSDIVREMRNIRIDYVNGSPVLRSTRGDCVALWIDGMHWPSFVLGDTDQMIYPEDIAAIETYSSVTTPAEFTQMTTGSCAAIVVWTRARVRDIDR